MADQYKWCLHCERTYKKGEHRLIDGLKMCPYDDCHGDTFVDGWDWIKIKQEHPEYPEIPEKGKVYPMY